MPGRERRVVTPDGYVWFVRRRWARRRPFWSRRGRRHLERFHGEELPAEKVPVHLGVMDLLTTQDGHHRGRPRISRSFDDAVNTVLLALLAVVALAALLAWLTVRYVLSWMVPPVVDNARLLLAAAAILAVVTVADHLLRPWYVELQRQGLADAPRRVWRVRGWRRSGRLIGEITAAIQDGRIDNRRAVILLSEGRR